MTACRKQRSWTPEQRAEQSRKLRERKIWLAATGPKTPEGKSASSRNAYKHGGYSAATKQEDRWITAFLRYNKLCLAAWKFLLEQGDVPDKSQESDPDFQTNELIDLLKKHLQTQTAAQNKKNQKAPISPVPFSVTPVSSVVNQITNRIISYPSIQGCPTKLRQKTTPVCSVNQMDNCHRNDNLPQEKMMTDVKICGIKTPEILAAAVAAGTRFVGFVFVPDSPRAIHPEQARLLARQLPTGVRAVGLFVNPDDETLSRTLAAVPLDFIQLHGQESPARVQDIKSRYALPVIKAFSVSTKDDLAQVETYISVIDWILFDAKAPATSSIAGGNGVPFDWKILEGQTFAKPWMLSGGLTPDNITAALETLTPDAVDVSSGVEISRGIKDAAKITDFIARVRR